MKSNTNTSIPGIDVSVSDTRAEYYQGVGPWLPLVQCLQNAGKSLGHSVVKVRVVVDAQGRPQHWTKPTVTHIEPWGKEPDAAVMDALVEE